MKRKDKIFHGNTINIVENPDEDLHDELREEYDLDELELKPNPYVNKKRFLIELSPDVAKYFKNSKQVNDFLRNQIDQFRRVIP